MKLTVKVMQIYPNAPLLTEQTEFKCFKSFNINRKRRFVAVYHRINSDPHF